MSQGERALRLPWARLEGTRNSSSLHPTGGPAYAITPYTFVNPPSLTDHPSPNLHPCPFQAAGQAVSSHWLLRFHANDPTGRRQSLPKQCLWFSKDAPRAGNALEKGRNVTKKNSIPSSISIYVQKPLIFQPMELDSNCTCTGIAAWSADRTNLIIKNPEKKRLAKMRGRRISKAGASVFA